MKGLILALVVALTLPGLPVWGWLGSMPAPVQVAVPWSLFLLTGVLIYLLGRRRARADHDSP